MRDVLNTFKALSDETRLRILSLLLQQELCVCEGVDILDMNQSRVSNQLQILKNALLANDRSEGKWIFYSLNSQKDYRINQKFFDLLKDILTRSEQIREAKSLLKRCLQGNVRELCPSMKENKNENE
jgi:ArsR family transcriptional regulator